MLMKPRSPKLPAFEFAPIVHVASHGNMLEVLLDSNHADDRARGPGLFRIPREAVEFGVHVVADDSVAPQDGAPGVLAMMVTISPITMPEGSRADGVIASSRLAFEVVSVADRARRMALISNAYKSAWSRAVAPVMGDQRPMADMPAATAARAKASAGLLPAMAGVSVRTRQNRLVLAALVGPVLAVLLIWALRSNSGPTDVERAVNAAMMQDPALIETQVDLTRNTLKQMGIDPGKPGDLGCLAPR